jgi:hypothetical protein
VDNSPDHNKAQRKSRLTKILGALFLFAIIMGPGPGLYLINGYAESGGALFGVPVLYAWCVFWFVVETVVVLIASKTLWNKS